jgi:Ca-activated chloride channel family protein
LKRFFKFVSCWLVLALIIVMTAGCSGSGTTSSGATVLGSGGTVLRIISGSENKELESILEDFCNKEHVRIEMTYKGSLDIMRTLESTDIPYDAVWPANSMWISVGDVNHVVKHAESISITPVVFGIRQSLAEELGFVGTEVSVSDILEAIRAGKLSFCMTSATQSNSGCCAYIGFLYALLGNPDVITSEDLDNEELKTEIKDLLSGVDRSSGSSNWLKEMFLESDYDAMVNYECLMIQADEELVSRGDEPLYVVYPYDGLSIADSPLGYVDNGDSKKEEVFLKLQEYLLSADVQNEIQRTGRRTGYTGVSEDNLDVFKSEWGVQPDRVLSPFTMPSQDVLFKALDLYQTEFKKPSFTVYCLDYSGSMYGDGNAQLVSAMQQVLIQDKASENFLQASESDMNMIVMFNSGIIAVYMAEGNGTAIEELYGYVKDQSVGGGTDIYLAAAKAVELMSRYDLSKYTPAVILLTDGDSQGYTSEFTEVYDELGADIPVFSIMFGDAQEDQLQYLADYTNARVFDGRTDLIAAFLSVKGYN